MSRRLVRFIQLAITVGVVALLLHLVDLAPVGKALRRANPLFLSLAFIIALLDRLVMIAKWYPFLRLQAPSITFAQATRAYLAAGFTNYLLPSTVGSDALRAAALGHRDGLVLEVGASIAAERLFGMLANGLVVMLSVIVALKAAVPVGMAGPLALGVFLLAAVVGLLPLVERAREVAMRILPVGLLGRHERYLHRFVSAYAAYARYPRMLVIVGAMTLVEVFFPLFINWILCIALQVQVGAAALLVAVPISSLVAKVPISVAGIGPQEATLVSLLALFGVAPEQGLAVAILARAIDMAIAIPGAFLWRDLIRGMRSAQPDA